MTQVSQVPDSLRLSRRGHRRRRLERHLESGGVERGLDALPQLTRDVPLRERFGLHGQSDRHTVDTEILYAEHLRLVEDLPGVRRLVPQRVGDLLDEVDGEVDVVAVSDRDV